MEKQLTDYREYEELYERLAAYARSDYYPFHMPAHKRAELTFTNPYQIDITEIEGFDNLYHAQDILLNAQQRLAQIFQSKRSWFLINGSTGGILSAIGALVKRGDHVLIARNCHKSVYHAIKLFQLKADYVYPELMECGIQGNIKPDAVEEALKHQAQTRLVVITSPTYDGIVSDIREIAEIAHKYGANVMVDEAHGAHLALSTYFPDSALSQGADLVVHSLHKTLPGFTQTAALHIVNERVDCGKLEETLRIFQSSSPSYLLMASIDRCVGLLERSGKQLFETYQKRLLRFYEAAQKLKHLHVLTEKDYKTYAAWTVDHGKILISTRGTRINGVKLYDLLLERYRLQMELYSAEYVLAMTSIMDTQEGFDRLFWALLEIDRELDNTEEMLEDNRTEQLLQKVYAPREKVMEISDTDDYNIEEIRIENSIGKVCAEYIYLYPPGIPMIVPGEVMTQELADILESCRKLGLQVQGTRDKQYKKILTVAYNE